MISTNRVAGRWGRAAGGRAGRARSKEREIERIEEIDNLKGGAIFIIYNIINI